MKLKNFRLQFLEMDKIGKAIRKFARKKR